MSTQSKLHSAELLLQEAVYRSRSSQAADTSLAGANTKLPAGAGRCGLGERAVVELELSERGGELATELWPEGLDDDALEHVRGVLTAFVLRQDALDRTRNHFLRDFRGEHGFDRATYSPEVAGSYRSGLDAINADESAERRAAAQRLLECPG